MNDVLKILLGSAISLLSTVIWHHIQFRKTNRFSYKNIVRNLDRLTTDTIKQMTKQIDLLDEYCEVVELDPSELQSVKILGYKPWEILAVEIKRDAGYTAFSSLLSHRLDAYEQFSNLRRYSTAMDSAFAALHKIIEVGMDGYYEHLTSMKAMIDTEHRREKVNAYKSYGEAIEPQLIQVRRFMSDVVNSNELVPAMKLYERVFQPTHDIFRLMPLIPEPLTGFFNVNHQLTTTAKSLLRHNNRFAEKIREANSVMKECRDKLEPVAQYLKDRKQEGSY